MYVPKFHSKKRNKDIVKNKISDKNAVDWSSSFIPSLSGTKRDIEIIA